MVDEHDCPDRPIYHFRILKDNNTWYIEIDDDERYYYKEIGISHCPYCGVRLDDITTKFWNNLTAKEMKEKYEMIDDG